MRANLIILKNNEFTPAIQVVTVIEHFCIISPTITKCVMQSEVAMLGALIHRAGDARTMPKTYALHDAKSVFHKWQFSSFVSRLDAEGLIPPSLANKSTPQMWVKLIQEHFESVRDVSPVEARGHFVGMTVAVTLGVSA